MNIQELFPPPQTSHAAQPKKQLGQEDFMKLLVAQMNNQNPTDPSDNGAFMAQLAQFSMVNGIEKLGKSVDGMSGSINNTQALQAANIVGHQVLTDGNIAALEDGHPVTARVAVPQLTTGLNIQVRDAAGSLVKTVPSNGFSIGVNEFAWDGTNERGEAMPAGDYQFSATALVDGKQQALPMQVYGTVQSIAIGEDRSSLELQLSNQQRIKLSQVAQYR